MSIIKSKNGSSSVLQVASHHRFFPTSPNDNNRKLIDCYHSFNRDPTQVSTTTVRLNCLNSLSWHSIGQTEQTMRRCNRYRLATTHSFVNIQLYFGVWVERGSNPLSCCVMLRPSCFRRFAYELRINIISALYIFKFFFVVIEQALVFLKESNFYLILICMN